MHLRAFSLRLLIALGVILNGSPLAMAYAPNSMHATASGQVIEKVVPSGAMAEMPCHDTGAGNSPFVAIEKLGTAESAPAAMPADCCDGGACSCACVHVFAAIPVIAFVAALSSPASIDVAAVVRHATPVLPQQSRPPIS